MSSASINLSLFVIKVLWQYDKCLAAVLQDSCSSSGMAVYHALEIGVKLQFLKKTRVFMASAGSVCLVKLFFVIH